MKFRTCVCQNCARVFKVDAYFEDEADCPFCHNREIKKTRVEFPDNPEPKDAIIIEIGGLAETGFFKEEDAEKYLKENYGKTLEQVEKDMQEGVSKVEIQYVRIE